MRCAAFDLGASSGKLFTGALCGDRMQLNPVYRFPNRMIRFSNGLYWDFFAILENMNLGLRKAARDGGVDSFGVDSFNNDFSLIDRHGELLLPVRSYRDPRTEAWRKEIDRILPPERLYAYTGNQRAPFNTLMQLAAMSLSGQGGLFEAAETMLFLPDLLTFAMTGIRRAEYTVAAESQFLDLITCRWIQEILAAFDIPDRILPEVQMPGTRLGRASDAYCRDQGLHPFEVVSVCQHDTASAFLTAPNGREGAYISSGTWSLVGIETDAPVITELTFRHNIANEGGYPGHHRLLKNVMGTWILQELLREYASEGTEINFEQAQALARKAQPFGFMMDPDAPAFFEPGRMRDKIRAESLRACGRAPESPGEFFRCVYEGLALRYRYALELLEEASGRSIAWINVMGGGSQDAFACQCTADAAGRTVLAGPADASAIGNLMVQMMAQGMLDNVRQGRELVARSFPRKIYTPANADAWEAQYQAFQAYLERETL